MSKNILFVTYKLQSYRIPIFNLIAEDNGINLTVAHSSKRSENKENKFDEVIINFKKIGKFTYYDKEFNELVGQFDAVVCMFYLFNLSFLKLALRRKVKLIFWGIGVRASYNARFDSPTFMNNIRYFLARRSDAMLFYSDYARNKYIKKGIAADKLFVMHNTVEVLPLEKNVVRDNILFIGSLYKQKKIFELLESYKNALGDFDGKPKRLHIIGKGAEFDRIKEWIGKYKLENHIVLHGAIFEEARLKELFSSAIACISPGQAGLSVLKSFGYGVPFITYEHAITGGERLNITNNGNGILFKDFKQLDTIILEIFKDPNKFIKMGDNAKVFYDNHRTPMIMANGFIDAINYVNA
ncbi:glycosyltransferase [Muricauda sp. JGD-17]|uniref:Glycosyltransferase n=1 Tax=Flagellimonas ochracea TaxID=2696472 RepID=A0A964TAE8_9FLAO|nr:glycosyltransferase family 4 protein [Allomuricauda ochracea]NAY91227.1 glycosyltransferase [Allomuricauda ochracea]